MDSAVCDHEPECEPAVHPKTHIEDRGSAQTHTLTIANDYLVESATEQAPSAPYAGRIHQQWHREKLGKQSNNAVLRQIIDCQHVDPGHAISSPHKISYLDALLPWLPSIACHIEQRTNSEVGADCAVEGGLSVLALEQLTHATFLTQVCI